MMKNEFVARRSVEHNLRACLFKTHNIFTRIVSPSSPIVVNWCLKCSREGINSAYFRVHHRGALAMDLTRNRWYGNRVCTTISPLHTIRDGWVLCEKAAFTIMSLVRPTWSLYPRANDQQVGRYTVTLSHRLYRYNSVSASPVGKISRNKIV